MCLISLFCKEKTAYELRISDWSSDVFCTDRTNRNDASEIEMVEAAGGSNPRFGDGASFRFVRSEGRTCPSHRCRVPASEFQMRVGEKRYRVTLDGGNHFYLAAIWEPEIGRAHV